MKINLGVIVQQYGYGNTDMDTLDVANELEARYGLFTQFWNVHQDEIVADAGQTIADAIIREIQDGVQPTGAYTLSDAVSAFDRFLNNEEMAGLGIDGVPTLAALQGRDSRRKKMKGPRRPSFIDGGLLKANFIAWVDYGD